MSGKLYLCATPIGNLEDITLRVLRTLKEVDLIAAEDTRNSIKLLNHFEIKTPMTSYHEYNKIEKAYTLIEKMQNGMNIALITDAGTPGISDPGEELAAMCYEAGIEVTSLPGPAACITALTLSGLPTRRFAFEAFLPMDKKERKEVLEELVNETRTIILYEAPHKLVRTLRDLREKLGNRRMTLCRELTKKHETAFHSTIDDLIAHYEKEKPLGECVLVIEGKSRQELKEAADGFVKRGEEVTFTITTTFPSFTVADSEDNTFKIIDTPTGLDIQEITSVKIGDTSLKANEDYTTNKADDGKYTIEFTKNTIGTSNTNAGKKVEVQYKAIVTSEEGYTNTANTSRNETEMGKTEVKGYTGTITLTKYAEDGKTILKGAEFKLYKATKDKVKEENSGVSALRFIKLGDGIYKLALADNEATSTDTLVAVNGTLTVKGLDEGTYWFEETKAPEGYSINVDGASATIKESKDKNVTVPTSLKDTKLSALPSTGGMGTYFFTIIGVVVMAGAAGAFFISRRKGSEE